LYRQDGSNESAAQLLEKAAKIVETTNAEMAIGLYLKAADTVGIEDRPREATEYMARAVKFQVHFILAMQTGIRSGSCNPSCWEVGI
jgi:hypothetical protein